MTLTTVRTYLACVLVATVTHASCVLAQAPTSRPVLTNAELDAKLQRMLRYDVPLVSVDSLAALQAGGLTPKPLLLDVREAEEYAVSHLPGAVRVEPGGDLPAWLDTVEQNRPIVTYCSVGYRSERYGRALREAGFTEVHNLYGSLFEWAERGYGVVDSTGRLTAAIHTYNRRWGQWLTTADAEKVY